MCPDAPLLPLGRGHAGQDSSRGVCCVNFTVINEAFVLPPGSVWEMLHEDDRKGHSAYPPDNADAGSPR